MVTEKGHILYVSLKPMQILYDCISCVERHRNVTKHVNIV